MTSEKQRAKRVALNKSWFLGTLLAAWMMCPAVTFARDPLPSHLVALTFDDSVKSHFTIVRPILKKYGFGATFFITEGFDFKRDKQNYMTWDEIATLHRDGFEIGNHTRDHLGITAKNVSQLREQLEAINQQCVAHGIPRTTSFAYPGNSTDVSAFPVLSKAGILFARRGGQPEYAYKEGRGVAYEPGLDHPLLIPSAGDARPDWELSDLIRAVKLARHGRISVLQFHGVPDRAHPWVNTPRDKFEAFMKYLAINKYKVISMRELKKYVDADVRPHDVFGVIKDRQQLIAKGRTTDEVRRPANDEEQEFWLRNMVQFHRFSIDEVSAATGMKPQEIRAALERWKIPSGGDIPAAKERLLALPYPGGRHPRIGFLDGAIRPQRDTKVSVFLPWNSREYVVLDVPEAIRWHQEREQGLLYLAHTHVPTMWSNKGVELRPSEWQRAGGELKMKRVLPNGVEFGTRVIPGKKSIRMEMWLKNGSEQVLRGLSVQNCVMLKGAPEFAAITTDNKVFQKPYAACRSSKGDRWIISAWSSCQRTWGNASCPCLHSDPQFADCRPGETARLKGWLSFYEGTNLAAELERIEALGWRR